jgi:hypothetical protein
MDSTAIEEEPDADINYPGPIDGSSLIEFKWDLLIDPFEPKKYQNYILKQDLAEGRDFMLVNHKIFKMFKDVYGGMEVKRLIISHLHTKKTYADVK